MPKDLGYPPLNRFEQIFKAKPRRRRRREREDEGEQHDPIGSREEKRLLAAKEAPAMDSTTRILKNVSSMGEHEYTRIITDYAKQQYPELTRERAFAKVFEDPDSTAIRRLWLLTKGQRVAPLDDDEAGEEARGVENDALEELEEMAAAERKRNPKLTKAQSFAKVYADPANIELAQRERRANRPRA